MRKHILGGYVTMSTKIHNGFRFNGSLMDAHNFFKEIRKDAKIIVETEYKKLFVMKLCCEYDSYYGGLVSNKPDRVLSSFWKELSERKREVRSKFKSDLIVDYSFEIVLMPISSRKILGIPYTDHNVLLSLLTSSKYFIEYGYWDNTDPPENLSAREWRQRNIDWDKALNEFNGVPSMCGMNFSITNDIGIPIFTRSELKEFAPDMYSRCKYIAKEILKESFFKDDANISQAFKSDSKYRDYLESEEGKQALEYTITKLALKLPPTDDVLVME